MPSETAALTIDMENDDFEPVLRAASQSCPIDSVRLSVREPAPLQAAGSPVVSFLLDSHAVALVLGGLGIGVGLAAKKIIEKSAEDLYGWLKKRVVSNPGTNAEEIRFQVWTIHTLAELCRKQHEVIMREIRQGGYGQPAVTCRVQAPPWPLSLLNLEIYYLGPFAHEHSKPMPAVEWSGSEPHSDLRVLTNILWPVARLLHAELPDLAYSVGGSVGPGATNRYWFLIMKAPPLPPGPRGELYGQARLASVTLDMHGAITELEAERGDPSGKYAEQLKSALGRCPAFITDETTKQVHWIDCSRAADVGVIIDSFAAACAGGYVPCPQCMANCYDERDGYAR
jgi:hypothetical protein